MNNIMKKFITLLLVAGTLLSACQAQTGIPQDVKDNIKARVDHGSHPGIVVGVVDGDKTAFFSYGVRSLTGNEPVNEYAVFEIGSITKTFTGIILADQVLNGKMNLSDPLQKFLPEGVTAPTRNGESIKLINLANHTSSLPRMPDNFNPANPANPFADYTEKKMYEFLSGYKLNRNIGSEYEYSNFGAGLLGHIIAAKEEKTYEQLMVELIAQPLGLQNTRITFTTEMKSNLAMGHSGGAQVENWDITTLAGAGAIRSTAIDMIKYVQANMGIMKTKLYPAMQLSHKNSRREGAEPMVGLGWHITPAGKDEIVWHNGGTGGYRSFIGFVNGGNKGVVVMGNSDASVDDIGTHLLNSEAPLAAIINEITVDPAKLEHYVGSYQLVPDFILTVTRIDNQLNAQLTGQPAFPIFAKTENVFFYKIVEAQLTFNRNAEGVVESVTLHQGGRDIVGKKIN
jgi:serine-type D-Ala-D-Ala carboxypeptidase/endopeptidase